MRLSGGFDVDFGLPVKVLITEPYEFYFPSVSVVSGLFDVWCRRFGIKAHTLCSSESVQFQISSDRRQRPCST